MHLIGRLLNSPKRKRTIRSNSNATPSDAPLLTPKTDGPASGLRNTVCICNPLTDRPAPANKAVMVGCVFCDSLFKFHHLFSLFGYQCFLFFGSAVQKNIKQIFDMVFPLHCFHEQRMQFISRHCRCVLRFPCSEKMEVVCQHLAAMVFFLLIFLFGRGFPDMRSDRWLLSAVISLMNGTLDIKRGSV